MKTSLLAIFALSLLLCTIATASEKITVYGRITVAKIGAAASCSICIDCDGFSSGTRRKISCHPKFYDSMKYKIDAAPKRMGAECGLELVGEPVLLRPEEKLPTYPDRAELQKTLACESSDGR